jgi:hypothetical protein
MAISVLNPTSQFFDNAGDPLNGGTVTVQDAGTTDARAIYTDTALSSSATNPIPLDAYGRPTQGMIYTAATAYKLIGKSSAGTTLWTRDNIDPGVPIGTGVLAIANGGTGASTGSAALAALGGATAAELADLSAEVAAVTGALGSTEKTAIAKGSTAQRPASPETSHIRYNTTTSAYEFYTGTWQNPLYTESLLAGSVVKSSYTEYLSNASLTTQMVYDDSIPQIGEGTEILTVSYTPTSATNVLRIRFQGNYGVSNGPATTIAALYGGGAANAIAATADRIENADVPGSLVIEHQETAGTTSPKTFAVRVGPASAITVRMNGTSAARRLGGVSKATLVIEEIKV